MITKQENLQQLRESRARLDEALARLTPEQLLQPGVVGEWSVKDIMAHVISWEQHLLSDYGKLFSGEEVREFESNDEINAINAATYARYRDIPLPEIRAEFERSYQQVVAWLEAATDEQLSTPYLYKMTVGEFVKVDTWGHYAEHIEQIEKAFRES